MDGKLLAKVLCKIVAEHHYIAAYASKNWEKIILDIFHTFHIEFQKSLSGFH